jgi:beta-1,4-mannosyl-glycoprotein beta-1,4-N-acetylglucosaminyltransferase
MIVDAFLFYEELDLLRLRLEVLQGVVDAFVLVRGDRTFRGTPIRREDVDAAIAALAKDYQIDTCVVELPVIASSPWEREHQQRRVMTEAIAGLVKISDPDTILLSDLDEVPRPSRLDEAVSVTGTGRACCFQQLHSYFALNLIDEEPWFGTRAIRWRDLKRTDAQQLREDISNQHVICDGGWHFGWIGPNDAIRRKLSAFSHEELDTPGVTADRHLDACRAGQQTVHNGHALSLLQLDRLPDCIQRNPRQYRHMLVGPLGTK